MLKKFLTHYFYFGEYKAKLHTEIIAGFTTFLTMVYVAIVNPAILSGAGMDKGAVFIATCLAAALGSLLMGLWAKYPIGVAPSMGLNAYFTYTVVQKLGYSWQIGLGAVFLAGIVFFLLTAMSVRQKIIYGLPLSIKISLSAGIGLFIGIIALHNLSIVSVTGTLVQWHWVAFWDIRTFLALLGLIIIALLGYWRIPGAMIIGILLTTVAGVALKLSSFGGVISQPPSLIPTFIKLQFSTVWDVQLILVIITFFFVALFDNIGTLIAVLQQTQLVKTDGNVPRLTQALFVDSIATMIGAVLGTSTTGSYVESSAGVRAGGTTGVTAIVVGLLFLAMLFFAPLAKAVPTYATAPALFYVAYLMVKNLRLINWRDITQSIPAAVMVLTMPLTFSIAKGIALGLFSYCLMLLFTGDVKKLNPALAIIAVVFLTLEFLQWQNFP